MNSSDQLKCSHCKQYKPLTDFYATTSTKRGYTYLCKICQSIVRKPDKRDPEKERERHRKRRLMLKISNPHYQNVMPESEVDRRERLRIAHLAHAAVDQAVQRGKLPRITSLECARCHAPATNYHHPSYRPNDRLNVIPLCMTCHRAVHFRPEVAEEVESGVVLTSVGMVRIAIASLP